MREEIEYTHHSEERETKKGVKEIACGFDRGLKLRSTH